MRVDLGGGEVRVAEPFADLVQADASDGQLGGEGVMDDAAGMPEKPTESRRS